MLQVISALRYPAEPAKNRAENELLQDAKLYAAAERYDIPTLRTGCAHAFKELLSIIGNRKSRMLFIRELLPLLYKITPATDRVLRKIFEKFVVDKWFLLLPRKDILDFALENEHFGAFLHKKHHKYWQRNGKQWCDSCKGHRSVNKSSSCNGCGRML
jgi:hypothetical protein